MRDTKFKHMTNIERANLLIETFLLVLIALVAVFLYFEKEYI